MNMVGQPQSAWLWTPQCNSHLSFPLTYLSLPKRACSQTNRHFQSRNAQTTTACIVTICS